MMSAAAVRLIRSGGVTQTVGGRRLAAMGWWALGGESEALVERLREGAVGCGSRSSGDAAVDAAVDAGAHADADAGRLGERSEGCEGFEGGEGGVRA